MSEVIRARLNDAGTEIIEYPVYPVHIETRAHPVDWYVECVFNKKPVVPAFHYAREIHEIVDGKVVVSYEVLAQTLQELLNSINNKKSMLLGPGTPVTIADVEADTIDRVIELAKQHVQDLLDGFARQKGYDHLERAINYMNSSVPEYAADAQIANAKRDQTWPALYTYLNEILAGTKPIPTRVSDIEAVMPELVWA